MGRITVVGLGPGGADQLTLAARATLEAQATLYVRSAAHPALADLAPAVRLRPLAQGASADGNLAEAMAAQLLAEAQGQDELVYAVPGHPLVGDATTRLLLQQAPARGVEVKIVAGLSLVDAACAALALDPTAAGLQIVDALELLPRTAPAAEGADRAWVELQGRGRYQPALHPYPLHPVRPALICQLTPASLAPLREALSQRYPGSHALAVVHGELPPCRGEVVRTTLDQLHEGQLCAALSCLYLEPLAIHEDIRSLEGLRWVIERLLGPYGCPWDREQTHHSLRPFLLEEAHEVLEALDAGDDDALAEELGDLLLQILLHAELGRQDGRFDFGSVTQHLASKLIRRHPHVFGDLAVSGSAEVLRNWESIKADENKQKGKQRTSLLDGIPPALPALAQAQKVVEKAAKVGFDWPDVSGVWNKLQEEIAELQAAPTAEQAGEIGDLLFVLVNLACWMEVDAESALRETVGKFRRRFSHIERGAQALGRDLKTMSLEEMDALWDEAKTLEQPPDGAS